MFACPKCGATPGTCTTEIDVHEPIGCGGGDCCDDTCDGFICVCDIPTQDEHGTLSEPCAQAQCFCCGYDGPFPVVDSL